ncbi:hypothetical protein AB5I41_05990 [Sphingomonas sp. MMS24-JH45]
MPDMIRKLLAPTMLAAVLPVLAGADQPRAAVRSCAGADLSRAMPVVDRMRRDPGTRALLVLVDGCPALKAYGPGYSDANRFISWSMAKTVTAMLVGRCALMTKASLDDALPRSPG